MSFGIRLFLFLISFILFSSCYKEQTTMATIIVKDSAGNLIEDAQVRIYAEPTASGAIESDLELIKNTNNRGEAYFNLSSLYEPGQNGVGIFAVQCQKLNLIGNGVIEIEQEENNIAEVIIF